MIRSSDIHDARILIVDDQEANVRLLERMLRETGYKFVTSTMNPLEVCALHLANSYDLFLLDLQMPGMDGFQVMEALKKIETEGYLPVLVITAQPGHKLRALAAGAKDFISKPFDLGEVLLRVRNMLEVRLLHMEMKKCNKLLAQTVQELEASREIIRLEALEEQSRSELEFILAEETQKSLLPRCLPQFDGFRIHAFNSPTRYVGGDFYDFVPLNSGEWVGVLADVSGKGMSAALLSSMVLGALTMELRAGTELREILHRINRLLCDKSLDYQFVTLFLFLMGQDGRGQFISAGHNPAYLFRAASEKIEELTSDSHFLGMFEREIYSPSPLTLDEGDILVVYSDGLTEAENQHQEVFGEARLRTIIKKWGCSGGCVIQQKLLAAVEEFTERMPQTDDVTFVIVERAGNRIPYPG